MSRILILIAAFWSAIAPAALADIPGVQPAEIVVPEPPGNLPSKTAAGMARLIHILRELERQPDIGIDDAIIEEAQAFREFVEDNPEIMEKNVAAMTKAELELYSEALSSGLEASRAIIPITKALASKDWLRNANEELAEYIERECGRGYVSGRDMYRQAALVLQSAADLDGEGRNLLDDVRQSHQACYKGILDYSTALEAEINGIDTYLAGKRAELAEELAKENPDEGKVGALKAEIEAGEKRKEELEAEANLLAALKFAMGVAWAAASMAAIVASGGSCLSCYTELASAAALTSEGWNGLTQDPGERVVQDPPQRDLAPDTDPESTTRETARADIENDDDLDFIETSDDSGNFLFARNGDRNIVILQIEPRKQFVVDMAKAKPGAGGTEEIAPKARWNEISWGQVLAPAEISRTRTAFTMIGELDGTAIEVQFNEQPVGQPFTVTAKTR